MGLDQHHNYVEKLPLGTLHDLDSHLQRRHGLVIANLSELPPGTLADRHEAMHDHAQDRGAPHGREHRPERLARFVVEVRERAGYDLLVDAGLVAFAVDRVVDGGVDGLRTQVVVREVPRVGDALDRDTELVLPVMTRRTPQEQWDLVRHVHDYPDEWNYSVDPAGSKRCRTCGDVIHD